MCVCVCVCVCVRVYVCMCVCVRDMLHVDTEWAYKHFIFTVISQSAAGAREEEN